MKRTKFYCQYCDFRTIRENNLKLHNDNINILKKKYFLKFNNNKCKICNYEANNLCEILKHISDNHNNQLTNYPTKYSCNRCNFTSIRRKRIIEHKISKNHYHKNYLFNYDIFKNKLITNNLNLGFIILRHVNNNITSRYWILSHKCIRRNYPNNKIVIIDDNSNYDYIDLEYQNSLENTIVIDSEFKARGEILPYIYLIKNEFFKTACIIHDSVFIFNKINFYVNDYEMMWHFNSHKCDVPSFETKVLKNLTNDKNIFDFYKKKNWWKGCFGGMSVINLDFLLKLNSKYDLQKLVDYITDRKKRMGFERIWATILQYEVNMRQKSLFGDIFLYLKFIKKKFYNNKINTKRIKIDEIEKLYESNTKIPILKIFTGR